MSHLARSRQLWHDQILHDQCQEEQAPYLPYGSR
jgi:hypothetical protein